MDAQFEAILSLLHTKQNFEIVVRLVTNDLLAYEHSFHKVNLITFLLIQGHYKFIQYLFETLDYFRPIFYNEFKQYLKSDKCNPEHFDQIISKAMANHNDTNGINLLHNSFASIQYKNYYKLAKFLITSNLVNLDYVYWESNILHIICSQYFADDELRLRQNELIRLALLKKVSVNQLNSAHETPISIALKIAPYIIDMLLESQNNLNVDDLMKNQIMTRKNY